MPRRPDMPCAGCGKLMWRGGTSAPEGMARCRECRYVAHGAGAYKRGCRCEECKAYNARRMRRYAARHKERTGESLFAQYRPEGYKSDGGWIGVGRRLALYERDGWVCQICMEPVDRDADRQRDNLAPSLDHIVPRSHQLVPDHSDENLRTAHRGCNASRGADVDVSSR